MEPRLSTSKSWTQFPKEYLDQIHRVFADSFRDELRGSDLSVDGRIYAEEILLRVGYLERGRLKQNNFEVSVTYAANKDNAIEMIHTCIDAAASMMAENFSEEDPEFPRQWQAYDFEKKKIYLRYSTVNTDLEKQADALLGLDNEDLYSSQAETEDAFSHAEVDPRLNLDEESAAEMDLDMERNIENKNLAGRHTDSDAKKKSERLLH